MTTLVKGIVASLLAKLAENNQFLGVNGFNQGINLGDGAGSTIKQVLDPNSYASQRLLSTNFGFYSNWTDSLNQIMYGFAANVVRTGGFQYTVAAQLNAYAEDNAVSGATFGAVTQAWNKPTAATDLVGSEFSIINETPSTISAKVGSNIVFKNRADGVPTVVSGLLTNAYNTNSMALYISSQVRSLAGERCGWRFGIRFDEYSLDADAHGGAVGIDFASAHYLGVPDPLLGYYMTAAIRMRDFQSIMWNGDPTIAGNPTEPANPVRTYFDSVTSELKNTNTSVQFFCVNVGNGNIRFKNGSKLMLDGNNNGANLQYDVANTRFAFDNAGTNQFAVDVADGSLYMRHGATLLFEGTDVGALLQADVANPGTLGLLNAIFVPAQSISYLSALSHTTVGAAGGATALPATPKGYVDMYIEGVAYKMPYYNP